MTAALMCDGCGAIASSRGHSEEPGAVAWYELNRNPVEVPNGFDTIRSPVLEDFGERLTAGGSEVELKQWEYQPPLHFCTMACLRSWTNREDE